MLRRGLLALFIILGIILGITCMVWLITWRSVNDGGNPKLKFSSFKKFYALNPNRWILHDDWISCYRDDTYGTIIFDFGFIDYYRYKLWYRKRESDLKKKHNAEQLAHLITAVKKDIENTETTAQHQCEKAAIIIQGGWVKYE